MRFIIDKFAGAWNRQPEEMAERMSAKAQDLVKRAFDDVEPGQLVDYHLHVAGTGADESGNYLNPKIRSPLSPVRYIKYLGYLSATGVKNPDKAESEYIDRIIQQIKAIPIHGKYHLLAFDKYFTPEGEEDPSRTEMHISNEYVFNLAKKHPDLFLPTISIHPYRKDAVDQLDIWNVRGAQFVKWLPNTMGIDPASDLCTPFYEKMAELEMVLLSHAGDEKAIPGKRDDSLGNPLLLRRPLELDVKVVMAHCGGLGHNKDFETPGEPRTANFKLFKRLMQESKYEELLFGELSAATIIGRTGNTLKYLLETEELHARLVNGSDYPLPAINAIISTRSLMKQGFLSKEERQLLNEIYQYNPLLFDYVLKRTIKAPGSGKKFPPIVFMAHPDLCEWKELF